MNRNVKASLRRNEAIKAFHYPDLEALRSHVLAFVSATSGQWVAVVFIL